MGLGGEVMSASPTYTVESIDQGALPLVFNTYIKSAWNDGRGGHAASFTKREFCQAYHGRLESLLGSEPAPILLGITTPTTRASDALTPDEPRWYGGWLLAHGNAHVLAVHWVYVKNPFRHRGFAWALLDEAVRRAGEPARIVATHEVPRRKPRDAQRWRDVMARAGIERASLADALREVRV